MKRTALAIVRQACVSGGRVTPFARYTSCTSSAAHRSFVTRCAAAGTSSLLRSSRHPDCRVAQQSIVAYSTHIDGASDSANTDHSTEDSTGQRATATTTQQVEEVVVEEEVVKEELGDAQHQQQHQQQFSDPRDAILNAAVKHVHTHGWSQEALAAGAQDVGYPAVAQGMFPGGAIDLVYHFMDSATRDMSAQLSAMPLADMPVNDRIRAGVRTRLEAVIPVRKTWAQAMALGALPQNALSTAQHLGVMADEIWYLAGDRSTDLQWYSRRGLLIGLYTATELALLTDNSQDFSATWEFLDRRLRDVEAFGASVGETKSVAAAVAAGGASLLGGAVSVALPALRELSGNPLASGLSTVFEHVNDHLRGRPHSNTGHADDEPVDAARAHHHEEQPASTPSNPSPPSAS